MSTKCRYSTKASYFKTLDKHMHLHEDG
uniref:Uncharacterized protein n=1 Tax=Arundo donax TaxID=35708 RepID=A0A0A9HBN1_ARUDO